MSRHAAIYCRGKSRRANRAAVEALRNVASREGWTVVGTFVDESERTELEYDRLWRGIAAHDIDLLAVPSFTALADGVAGVLAEILRLRDAATGAKRSKQERQEGDPFHKMSGIPGMWPKWRAQRGLVRVPICGIDRRQARRISGRQVMIPSALLPRAPTLN